MMSLPDAPGLRRTRRWLPSPRLSPEALTLLVCVVFTLLYNGPFWHGMLADAPLVSVAAWESLSVEALVLTVLQFVVFLPFMTRHTVRPLLSLLVILAAVVNYFTTRYGTHFDTTMIDNVLQTDTREAGELLTPSFALYLLLYAGLPVLLLWCVRLTASRWPRALLRRSGYLVGAVAVLAASLMIGYQGLSSEMRNRPALRYLVTPGNALVSTGQVMAASDPLPAERLPLGEDAVKGVEGDKPRLLVLVVGETMRAADWGLDGYERQTTPRLAERDLVNFTDVSSCGTSTAVSVPCMFAPGGRGEQSEREIKSHESLLDVLSHAGFRVLWLDNQSGCKGVCQGVETRQIAAQDHPAQCPDGECLDGALFEEAARVAKGVDRDTVLVLHQLGNHGPSYYARYPDDYRVYTPTCDSAELSQCDRQAVVNSYDNAVRYTDALLDGLIGDLASLPGVDTAMLYVADHGESLGEHGLYLHGLPYAIAPDEQTHVPMVWWSSAGFDATAGLDDSCLAERAKRPASHANLFHTVLGVLGVETRVLQPERDLTRDCRGG
ncbi:phosphoethanolamine transferase [Halomonas sp. THAF12]|uniref:phosphoethanolamine transferase n=1 Tax=Halomonas sp. B23F22_10 TaxID=3459515 RepID=UPI00373E045C